MWNVFPPRRLHARATDGRFCVCGVQEDPVARPTSSRCRCCCRSGSFARHSLRRRCHHPLSLCVRPLASRVCVDRPHPTGGPPCRVAAVVLPVLARFVAADCFLRQQPAARGCSSLGCIGRGACTSGRSGGDVPLGRVGRRGVQAGHWWRHHCGRVGCRCLRVGICVHDVCIQHVVAGRVAPSVARANCGRRGSSRCGQSCGGYG